MNIKSQAIITELKQAVAEERRITTRILKLLRQVQDGRYYLGLGYSSLFDFTVRELGYAQDAAARRIGAMRLIADVPQIEEKIETGALSLSVVTEATKFLRAEKKVGVTRTAEEKRELVLSLEGLSKREAERSLLQKASPAAFQELQKIERTRAVTPDLTRLTITLTQEQQAKIEKLRSLLSHRNKGGTVAGLLDLLCEEALERHDPVRIETRRLKKQSQSAGPVRPVVIKKDVVGEKKIVVPSSRHIPAAVKRTVWLRDKGRCTFKDCGATRFLHFDHAQPFALGGGHNVENLHLLCSAHHGRATEEVFGPRAPEALKPTKITHSKAR